MGMLFLCVRKKKYEPLLPMKATHAFVQLSTRPTSVNSAVSPWLHLAINISRYAQVLLINSAFIDVSSTFPLSFNILPSVNRRLTPTNAQLLLV